MTAEPSRFAGRSPPTPWPGALVIAIKTLALLSAGGHAWFAWTVLFARGLLSAVGVGEAPGSAASTALGLFLLVGGATGLLALFQWLAVVGLLRNRWTPFVVIVAGVTLLADLAAFWFLLPDVGPALLALGFVAVQAATIALAVRQDESRISSP